MLHRNRSAVLKSLVGVAYFPWCSAHKTKHIEPCTFVNKYMDSTTENTIITFKWRRYYELWVYFLAEDKTDSCYSHEKIPLKAFTLAQMCSFSHWQYFYSVGHKQQCVMRFIKPVDWLVENLLMLLHISDWTSAMYMNLQCASSQNSGWHCLFPPSSVRSLRGGEN